MITKFSPKHHCSPVVLDDADSVGPEVSAECQWRVGLEPTPQASPYFVTYRGVASESRTWLRLDVIPECWDKAAGA